MNLYHVDYLVSHSFILSRSRAKVLLNPTSCKKAKRISFQLMIVVTTLTIFYDHVKWTLLNVLTTLAFTLSVQIKIHVPHLFGNSLKKHIYSLKFTVILYSTLYNSKEMVMGKQMNPTVAVYPHSTFIHESI